MCILAHLKLLSQERKSIMTTIATTVQPVISSPLKRLISRHPLLTYFVIAFVGSWASLLPFALSRGVNGLGLLPYKLPDSVFYIGGILFTFAGPALASLVVTAIITGRAGVGQLLRRFGALHTWSVAPRQSSRQIA
jgi:hypothetical protein